MLDRLIDVLLSVVDLFRFWEVVTEYRRGVRFRLGRVSGSLLQSGIHWRVPFGVDLVEHVNTTLETRALPPQSLTTSDGQDVTLSAVVSYKVVDPELFMVKAEDMGDVIGRVPAIVTGSVIDSDFDDIATGEWIANVYDDVREALMEYGIDAVEFGLANLCKAMPVRLVSAEYLSIASGSQGEA